MPAQIYESPINKVPYNPIEIGSLVGKVGVLVGKVGALVGKVGSSDINMHLGTN